MNLKRDDIVIIKSEKKSIKRFIEQLGNFILVKESNVLRDGSISPTSKKKSYPMSKIIGIQTEIKGLL
jgi:hypothetical protein